VRVQPFFKWFDFWVGWYWSAESRALYLCPLPMFGVKISFEERA